jgi:hypothetical protein
MLPSTCVAFAYTDAPQRVYWSEGRRNAKMSSAMADFPEFMKHPANRIANSGLATAGVEGYVFDGADGRQDGFWHLE